MRARRSRSCRARRVLRQVLGVLSVTYSQVSLMVTGSICIKVAKVPQDLAMFDAICGDVLIECGAANFELVNAMGINDRPIQAVEIINRSLLTTGAAFTNV